MRGWLLKRVTLIKQPNCVWTSPEILWLLSKQQYPEAYVVKKAKTIAAHLGLDVSLLQKQNRNGCPLWSILSPAEYLTAILLVDDMYSLALKCCRSLGYICQTINVCQIIVTLYITWLICRLLTCYLLPYNKYYFTNIKGIKHCCLSDKHLWYHFLARLYTPCRQFLDYKVKESGGWR